MRFTGTRRLGNPIALPSGLIWGAWLLWITAAAVPAAETQPATPVSPARTFLRGAEPGAEFGRALAAAGDVNGDGFDDLLVGAPSAAEHRGRVFLHLGSAVGLLPNAAWSITGEVAYEKLGISVAGVGDVNRDGFDDFVLSRFEAAVTNVPTSRLDLWLGSTNGPVRSAWSIQFPHPHFYLGARAGRAGDVNGDGIEDLFVGPAMLRHVPHPESSGTVHVFHGATNGPSTSPAWSATGAFRGDGFGASVAGAGDVNRDGFADLVVGAPLDDQAGSDSGRVYVFHGSRTGLSPMPNWSRHSPLTARDRFSSDESAYFGCSVSGAGDVNGDGYADIVVGANFAERDDVNEGVAVLFGGSSIGLESQPMWIGEPDQPFAAYGSSVAGGGDIDRDGFSDILVGAPTASDDQLQEGVVACYRGSRTGVRREAPWTAETDRTQDYLGEIVAFAGDINGDGCADVAMTAPGFRDKEGHVGAVFVSYGSQAGLRGTSRCRLTKPWSAAAQLWWDRADTARRAGAAGTIAALLGFAGAIVALAFHRRLVRERAASRRDGLIAAARDLHDEVGPHVTTLGVLAADSSRDASDARAPLPAIRTAIGELGETLDWLTWRWKSGGSDLRGEVESLFALAKVPAVAAGLDVVVEMGTLRAQAQLTPALKLELLPCIREAVNNVVRHARASRLTLRADLGTATRLRLEIEDDGKGLNGSLAGPGQDGLHNLKARLARIGGRFDVASEPGRGVLLSLEVPLESPEAG